MSGEPKDRPVIRRLYARGTWVLESAAHFGGDDLYTADMCLLRDGDGRPFIPGASVAGAAQDHLARRLYPWALYKKDADHPPLFGGLDPSKKKDVGRMMSPLFVADAKCVCFTTSVRDGVRIDPVSGVAADKARFDVEVLEPGSEFELRLECLIREGDGEQELRDQLRAVLRAFTDGEVRLGARTGRGSGRGRVGSWEIRDLDMGVPDDVLAWLSNNPWIRPAPKDDTGDLPEDMRSYFAIRAKLSLRTSLLIRSASEKPDDPDMVHLSSGGKAVVPGTSMAGAIRHRAGVIMRTLGWSDTYAEWLLAEMFGPVHEGDKKPGRGVGLWASRVRVEERKVSNVDSYLQERVAINRFTGGSLDQALFDERPVRPVREGDEEQGGQVHVLCDLVLEEPHDAEAGLLLLVLRDMWYGRLPIGGEVGVGRGTLQGVSADLEWRGAGEAGEGGSPAMTSEKWHLDQHNGAISVDGDASRLESFVTAAHNAPAGALKGSRRPPDKKTSRVQ